ncbi:hypothetical protein [Shumkonia mesophila]|uniref:hypothetical protein n=1 Tax=Shumkonia mesophila TaxID=2838854 RepID=UPI00293474D1|nr:hypothetical protein [Shumkonia mesophila]
MLATISTFLARKVLGFALGKILIGAACALASAVVVYLWNDYQDAKARVASLRQDVARAVDIHKEAVHLHQLAEAQLRADLATARATSQRRAAETQTLQAALAAVREARRPDHETACPVHPVFDVARRRLLDAAGAGDPPGH